MVRLIAANLRYRLPSLLTAVAAALAIAATANLVLPTVGMAPAPEDDFKLAYLFPVFVLFAFFFTEFGSMLRDHKEQRTLLHAQLPTRRRDVGAARAFTPAVVIICGLLLAEALMLVAQVALGTPLALWRFTFVAFFAGQFLAVLELPLIAAELRTSADSPTWVKTVFVSVLALVAVVVLLRALAPYVRLHPRLVYLLREVLSLNPESPVSTAALFAVAGLMALCTLALFMRRRSLLE